MREAAEYVPGGGEDYRGGVVGFAVVLAWDEGLCARGRHCILCLLEIVHQRQTWVNGRLVQVA